MSVISGAGWLKAAFRTETKNDKAGLGDVTEARANRLREVSCQKQNNKRYINNDWHLKWSRGYGVR